MTLEEFFEEHPKIALAFSGGVDSSYLLYAASRCGADVAAYYVKSQFQPEFELRDAIELAHKLGVRMRLIEQDIVSCAEVTANPPDRCYYCKKHIMGAIRERSCADGYALIIDGTNASDDISDRPGYKALGEEGILSPLRICGLTKAEIRRLSHEAGLPTWDKPAYACLATRIASGSRRRSCAPSSRARTICLHSPSLISATVCAETALCCNSQPNRRSAHTNASRR